MDNYEVEQEDRVRLYQKFLDIMCINQKIQLDEQKELNFQIEKHQTYYILAFRNGITFNFLDPSSLQQQQLNENIQKGIIDEFQFSYMCIFHYFYEVYSSKYYTQQETKTYNDKPSFIFLANKFMKLLKYNRQYTDANQINWRLWKVYWSKKEQESFCYSNCSGTCNQQCGNVPCQYYFDSDELQNQYLPEKERDDPFNIFDDNLLWIASLYDDFIKNEKFKYDHFFFSQEKEDDNNFQMQNKTKYNGIKVQTTSNNVVEFESLDQLYNFQDLVSIKSICILTLKQLNIPVGEESRQKLYQFILELPNLQSLQIQLENGIYHTNEEDYQDPTGDIMQAIPVSTDVLTNFRNFLLKLKVTSLSLLLNEECYPINIDLDPVLSAIPKINVQLKNLHISINYRRMKSAKFLLQYICQLDQLEWLHLEIKKQWHPYHSTNQRIDENFDEWRYLLKSTCPHLQTIEIR